MGFFNTSDQDNHVHNLLLNKKEILMGYRVDVLVEKYIGASKEIQQIIVQILKERGYSSREIEHMLKENK
ncbi:MULTISPECIES: hypothetical protein [Acinetobacter]|uniref:hypothetical protein n=1 Tax=Acinetobacter TaxID=469 RepID=UPI0002CDDB42|nr:MULTISPECIES: hypothetical protein [Acinetobacter]ENX57398.1 hypothetical protein F885_03557 [Acinetobacter higginsii]MCH7295599.1 hypothetical protein [Acinetobacter higginsii]MCH7306379.1 hypothetical protein [Acinetobacter higginsii]MCH7318591.1 hypothetical protein [Acinetobacter higginsii]MCH7338595.1 hypothetical protein [Acinetobacter higginsii]